MNVFDKYLDANDALNRGDVDRAAKILAKTFGGSEATGALVQNVKKALARGSRLNRAITDNLFGQERSNKRKARDKDDK